MTRLTSTARGRKTISATSRKSKSRKKFGKTVISNSEKQARILTTKEREKTKRYLGKQDRKTKEYQAKMDARKTAAKAKTIARSTAFGTSAVSTGTSTTAGNIAEARSKSDIAKYEALINGNIYGVNEVDPTKDGGQGNTNPSSYPHNNAYEGLF